MTINYMAEKNLGRRD